MKEMTFKKNKKVYISMILLIIGFFLIKYTGISRVLTFENLQQNKELLKIYVNENYIYAVSIYILTYIIVVTFALPGAGVLSLTGGFLFGIVGGMLYSNVGATIGAIFSFLSARYIIGEWIQKRYEEKLEKINEEIKENGKNYFLMLRLIPVFPFFLINLLAGLTSIPLTTFAWTTTIGIIPGSFAYSFAGNNLGNIQSAKDILSIHTILGFTALGALAILPIFLKKMKRKKS
jgi:uncharacterized membrane protein YdjX (TVP38/TMEM64 family)